MNPTVIRYSQRADKLLLHAEISMIALVKTHFEKVEATRWHWDAPDAMVEWRDAKGLARNLHVVLSSMPEQGDESAEFQVEINAWKDYDLINRQRRWRSESVGSARRPNLPHLLEEAFARVSVWNEDDLAMTSERPGEQYRDQGGLHL